MTQVKTRETIATGFALYVGISEADANSAGLTLTDIALALKNRLAELVPDKAGETYAALALAPQGAKGRNLDLTRIALGEPKASSKPAIEPASNTAAKGIVVDLTRKRVFVDGRNAQLTCKEFELLAFLIENTGKTLTRSDIAGISNRCGEAAPNFRTIDVHVRRLRAKIAGYEDIVRTQRGLGYRFDAHPDVLIEQL
jgi:DNA-binding winged helix-turn-helix (wHTH) protein